MAPIALRYPEPTAKTWRCHRFALNPMRDSAAGGGPETTPRCRQDGRRMPVAHQTESCCVEPHCCSAHRGGCGVVAGWLRRWLPHSRWLQLLQGKGRLERLFRFWGLRKSVRTRSELTRSKGIAAVVARLSEKASSRSGQSTSQRTRCSEGASAPTSAGPSAVHSTQ